MEFKCVYLHKNPINDEVFYIGIGNYDRPYMRSGRNMYWNDYVNNFGFKVEIIKKGLSYKQAAKEEIRLIKYYGRKIKGLGNLLNINKGGQGRGGEAIKQIICLNTGNIYKNLGECSQKINVPRTTLSKYLNNYKSQKKTSLRYMTDNKIIWFEHEKFNNDKYETIQDEWVFDVNMDNLNELKSPDIIARINNLDFVDMHIAYLVFYKRYTYREICKFTPINLTYLWKRAKIIRDFLVDEIPIIEKKQKKAAKHEKTFKKKLNYLKGYEYEEDFLIMLGIADWLPY